MSGFILKNQNSVFYECGYSCDNVIFISYHGDRFFLTDARYGIEAKELAKDVHVIEVDKALIKATRVLIKKLGIKRLEYDPMEFSVSSFEALSKNLGVKFIPKENFSQILRRIKTKDEIKTLKNAALFGAQCFDEFAAFVREFGEGMSEEELYFNACNIFSKQGSLDLSFKPIVAINENSAKAHALPTKKQLKKGDLLLLDAGVRYKNYCSDRTRTAFFDDKFNFSKNQNFQDELKNRVFDLVLKAQNAAINAIKPGIKASQIDKAAREIITNGGFGECFFHSTGHGVGVDIHELPIISAKSDEIIKEGMVFSVEPGIYLKGKFGVRIEDVVVVRKDGCEIL